MAAIADYLENKILDHVNGVAAYTAPATIYVALFTTATSDAGGGTEVSGGSYARQSVTFAAASGGAAASNIEVLFPRATANWGVVTHAALVDASTGGNFLFHGALASSRDIKSGDEFKFSAGDIIDSLD